MNAGIILFARTRRYLAARVAVERDRVATLDPTLDFEELERQLAVIPSICAGDPGAGPLARLSQAERFHWLVAPRSTVVQVSPVHAGVCSDPEAALEDLFRRLVLPPERNGDAP